MRVAFTATALPPSSSSAVTVLINHLRAMRAPPPPFSSHQTNAIWTPHCIVNPTPTTQHYSLSLSFSLSASLSFLAEGG